MASVPGDILLATAVMLGIAVATWFGAVRLARRRSRVATAIAAAAVIIMLAQAFWLADNLWLTRILPLADAIVWTNWSAPLAGLLAGVAWVKMAGPKWQRVIVVFALAIVGIVGQVRPVVGAAPPLRAAAWVNGICHQSSASSCSPAAGATLLHAYGLEASEAEMIRDCLTHDDGTTMLGLYRGLKIHSAGSGYTPRAGRPGLAALSHWPMPAVISLDVTRSGGVLGRNVVHSVVIFAFNNDGTADVGDPLSGRRQRWGLDQLQLRYRGDAICMVATQATRSAGK